MLKKKARYDCLGVACKGAGRSCPKVHCFWFPGTFMEFESFKKHSNFIINNNASYSELINSVDRFHQMIYQNAVNIVKSA